ncbi:hypothetical protein EZV73_25430 [Acidaminobacter sp. JC074]|uniref:hypothetical protein n=1 Tax=Acidaminobacter sp. JC074 TaxID=2530199 RepID=UPI001F118871|nr:hypothetical protein [Acidaminobacter sp. JC074]MCH4890947.1 hypothetical protein [Acidaminobacter sp. JC074]
MDVKLESLMMDLYYQKNRMQMQNYIFDSCYDITAIDERIYELLSNGDISYPFLLRTFVDSSPDCSCLLNRIDNYENYKKNISDEVEKGSIKYKVKIARAMKEDVIALMKARDMVAKALDYKSYPDLILSSDGLTIDELKKVLNKHLDKHLVDVKRLIKQHQLEWSTWFRDLDNICDKKENYSSNEYVQKVLTKFDLNLRSKIKLEISSELFASFVIATSKNDINVFIRESSTLGEVLALFHELGHAIHYSMIEGDGLKNILPSSLSEIMAVVIEYIATQILLEGDERRQLNEIMLIDYTRCAISSLFELDLYEKIGDAENLYVKHYTKLGLEVNNPSVWSYDSFRSIDPVYIHNYVLGYTIAKNMYEKLKDTYGDDYGKWGAWLVENIYKHGSNLHVQDIMNLSL